MTDSHPVLSINNSSQPENTVVKYTFQASIPLDGAWTISRDRRGPTLVTEDHYLRYQTGDYGNQYIGVSFSDEYYTSNGLGLIFRLRASSIQGADFEFLLPAGVALRFGKFGKPAKYFHLDHQGPQQLAPSTIQEDSTWHDIVMFITESTVTLIEDGVHLFSLNTSVGRGIRPQFDLHVLEGNVSFDLGELFVTSQNTIGILVATPWDYPILGSAPPIQTMSFRDQNQGPEVLFHQGYVQFRGKNSNNKWSWLDVPGVVEKAVLSYWISVNAYSPGSEIRITLPGDNILRLTNSGQMGSWICSDSDSTLFHHSRIRAGFGSFTVVSLVISESAISLFENGVFLYSRTYTQTGVARSPGLAVQFLGDRNFDSVEIGGLRCVPSTKQAVGYIDAIQDRVKNFFNHLSAQSYLRVLDTPHIWNMPFGDEIMLQACIRQGEFERAIVEIVQKAKYRCDLSSLNSPDPDWVKAILGAIDTAMSTTMGRVRPTQFRFLFGQTPTVPVGEPANYTDFKAALIRLFIERSQFWEMKPEIWMGRFYRLGDGIVSMLQAKVFGCAVIGSDGTKMTWNHTKVISVDGSEALVGGHNLNMDLFRNYPPVHDVSVVVHGEAAYGPQLFLNKMWECGTSLLTKEMLRTDSLTWVNFDADFSKPEDPLITPDAAAYMSARQNALIAMHQSGQQPGIDVRPPYREMPVPAAIRDQDLQTLADLDLEVFQERIAYHTYQGFSDYKLAARILTLGKYWNGPVGTTDFQNASEIMKEYLIKHAKHTIRMSQMDLISAWKKNWSDHVVSIWILEALLANPTLQVQIVLSPLDAGAGAGGDQYSFGSGASRTFDLMQYYMTHNSATDALLDDENGARAEALTRLFIAPLYFTNKVPADATVEGVTYKWPNLSNDGYTATLKQSPLTIKPPDHGQIGSAALSVINASGYIYNKVKSAPGNHAKIMIVDDEVYVVGSDNLYPGFLSEIDYIVEGKDAVSELIGSYWTPLWKYSGPHSISGASNFPKVTIIYISGGLKKTVIWALDLSWSLLQLKQKILLKIHADGRADSALQINVWGPDGMGMTADENLLRDFRLKTGDSINVDFRGGQFESGVVKNGPFLGNTGDRITPI